MRSGHLAWRLRRAMKRWKLVCSCLLLAVCLIMFFKLNTLNWKSVCVCEQNCLVDLKNFSDKTGLHRRVIRRRVEDSWTAQLAMVSCGGNVVESLVMLKSAVIMSKRPFHVHIFTDQKLMFKLTISTWPKQHRDKVNITYYEITYPNVDKSKWIGLFKPCASQRLFFPDVLTNLDKVLYVDTDVLFLGRVEDLWDKFRDFNSSQILALTEENSKWDRGWYRDVAKHPYYGSGINDGVMLMHLARMRELNWIGQLMPLIDLYKGKLELFDQDLLNVYFYFNPEKLYILSCEWNFRTEWCTNHTCEGFKKHGVKILHGNRGIFHSPFQPFRAFYNAFEKHSVTSNPRVIYKAIKEDMAKSDPPRFCGAILDSLDITFHRLL